MLEPPTRRTIGPQLPASGTVLKLGDQLRDFAKLVGKRLDTVHREVSIKLFTAIVYDTPIDTGLARGSWHPTLGVPFMGGPTRVDKGGNVVANQIELTFKSATINEVSFLSNNVPYIVPLEYGWSRQASEGMVRINVARFHRIVSEEVAAAKAGDRPGISMMERL